MRMERNLEISGFLNDTRNSVFIDYLHCLLHQHYMFRTQRFLIKWYSYNITINTIRVIINNVACCFHLLNTLDSFCGSNNKHLVDYIFAVVNFNKKLGT